MKCLGANYMYLDCTKKNCSIQHKEYFADFKKSQPFYGFEYTNSYKLIHPVAICHIDVFVQNKICGFLMGCCADALWRNW